MAKQEIKPDGFLRTVNILSRSCPVIRGQRQPPLACMLAAITVANELFKAKAEQSIEDLQKKLPDGNTKSREILERKLELRKINELLVTEKILVELAEAKND